MTEGDREEFERTLGVLFAGIDKPLGDAAREAFWKGLQKLSLTEFARCVDLLLRELEDYEGPPKRFSLADVWQAKRRLRAAAPPDPTVQPQLAWEGDVWDTNANARLLKHLVHSIIDRGQRYDVARIKRLVAAKNAWAADMRDLDDHGALGVRKELQDRCWLDIIAHAERVQAAA